MMSKIAYREKGRDSLFKIWHASKESMIILMHSDGGSIVCREKTFPIQPGTLCFVGAEKLHYTMPDRPDRYDRSKLFFPAQVTERLAALLPDDRNLTRFGEDSFVCTRLNEEDRSSAEEIFREIDAAKNTPYADRIFLSGCLKLLTLLERKADEVTGVSTDAMGHAIEYINRNLSSGLTVDRICRAVHVSKYHFCRKFKRSTGLTVMNYVLKTRIVSAKNLLRKTSRSVSEISEDCGFSSISYFCRVFKQDVGVSPLEYRKMNRKN